MKTWHDSAFMGVDAESKIEGHDKGECDDIAWAAAMSRLIVSDPPEMASASEYDFGSIVTSLPSPNIWSLSWIMNDLTGAFSRQCCTAARSGSAEKLRRSVRAPAGHALIH